MAMKESGKDFMYFLLKSLVKLEKKTEDGWVSYDAIYDDMMKHYYARTFLPDLISTFLDLGHYEMAFEERENKNGDLELRLYRDTDSDNIRWVFDLFELPYELIKYG